MFARCRSFFMKVKYKLKFGSSLKTAKKVFFPKNTDITIQNGKISIGAPFSASPGLRMAAVRGGEITIGNNVAFNRNTIMVCHQQISIGNGCSFGPNVTLYDHDHTFDSHGFSREKFKSAPIVIEDGVWIAAGVIILKGTHIGAGSVIGAGTVVRGHIPPHSLVTGNKEVIVRPIHDTPEYPDSSK